MAAGMGNFEAQTQFVSVHRSALDRFFLCPCALLQVNVTLIFFINIVLAYEWDFNGETMKLASAKFSCPFLRTCTSYHSGLCPCQRTISQTYLTVLYLLSNRLFYTVYILVFPTLPSPGHCCYGYRCQPVIRLLPSSYHL